MYGTQKRCAPYHMEHTAKNVEKFTKLYYENRFQKP